MVLSATAAQVSADAGSDVVLFSSSVTTSSVYGGFGGDSMVFKSLVSNSTDDFGADNDTVTFSSTVSNSTILGGAGADTLVFTTGANLLTSSVLGGAAADSLVFSAAVTGGTIAGGAGADTMSFAASLSGAIVSLDSGADSVDFTTLVAGNSTLFGGGGIQTVNFSSAADLASFDGVFGAGSLIAGSGNDTLVFQSGSTVNASTVVKLGAGDDSLTFNGNTVSGQFGGLAGNDYVGGSISVGNSGVSFWGGSGNDTFDFSMITGAGGSGTAYFWNEGGTDSIVLGSVVSGGFEGITAGAAAGVAFGITSGASMNISFLDAQVSASFGGGISGLFDVHNTLVTYGINSSNYITLAFVGGGEVQLQGFTAAEANAITATFDKAGGVGGTANFGSALSFQPSADTLSKKIYSASCSKAPFKGLFFCSFAHA